MSKSNELCKMALTDFKVAGNYLNSTRFRLRNDSACLSELFTFVFQSDIRESPDLNINCILPDLHMYDARINLILLSVVL